MFGGALSGSAATPHLSARGVTPPKLVGVLLRWLRRQGAGAGALPAHTIRVYGYRAPAHSRDADISDGAGKPRRGCVSIHNLGDFLAQAR